MVDGGHPEWTPDDDETTEWGPEVSSYAIDDGVRLLLIDPTFPPAPVASCPFRGVVVVLTSRGMGATPPSWSIGSGRRSGAAARRPGQIPFAASLHRG